MKKHVEKPWRPGKAYREGWRSSITTGWGTVVTVFSPDPDEGRAIHAQVERSLRRVEPTDDTAESNQENTETRCVGGRLK